MMFGMKAFKVLAFLPLLGLGHAPAPALAPANDTSAASTCEPCRLTSGSPSVRSISRSSFALPADLCYDTILLDRAGPYEYVVLVDGVVVQDARLTGDFSEGAGGMYRPPASIPASGMEEIVVTDGADSFETTVRLSVMTPLGSPGLVQAQSARQAVATPTIPDVNPHASVVLSPPSDVQVAPVRTLFGKTYSRVPVIVEEDGPVVEVYLRKPNGPALLAAKRCKRKRDGESCKVLPNLKQCDPPSISPIGPAVSISNTVQFMGNSVQVNYWGRPVKKVQRCDVYKCGPNNSLIYDYTQTCVTLGSQSWSFAPTSLPGPGGQILTQVLLGFDLNGYLFQPVPSCRRS